jgi:uncharacterized protein (UPF0261 family)
VGSGLPDCESKGVIAARTKRKGEMTKNIVIAGTLDTKGEEVKYLKGLIEKRGHKAIVIDTGILGAAPFLAEFTREQVAEAAGADLKEIIALGDESKAIAAMARGASKIVQELHSSGGLDGIVALGGSMGTSLGIGVMKALPLLMPKLMVSTVAFLPMMSPHVVSKDLTVMPTVADIWGLNRITKRVLKNAAAAIVAMVESYEEQEVPEKPLIGVTTLGSAACRYVPRIKPLLEGKGYEVAVFHTNGIGGGAFEEYVEQGLLAGALDLSLFELANHLYGTNSGIDRLEAMGKRGIPQVVAPGGMHFFGYYGSLEIVPPQLRDRKILWHNPLAFTMEMKTDEMVFVAEAMARKLNNAAGPTVLLIPTKGFSEYDRPGSALYQPEGRRLFIETLKSHIEPRIKVIELDLHINDREFAQEAVTIFDNLMKAGI